MDRKNFVKDSAIDIEAAHTEIDKTSKTLKAWRNSMHVYTGSSGSAKAKGKDKDEEAEAASPGGNGQTGTSKANGKDKDAGAEEASPRGRRARTDAKDGGDGDKEKQVAAVSRKRHKRQ